MLSGSGQANASGPSGSTSAAAVQASFLQPVWTWIQGVARTTGAFFASVYTSVRDFFASGDALRLLQSATHGINGFAVRLLLPVSSPIVPLLSRLLPGSMMTPELVALWIFWIIVALILVLLIVALRPRHTARRLPRVTPRTPGQEENTIQFGMVEQGPQPSPVTTPDRAARIHEPQAEPVSYEPAAVQPAAPEKPSSLRAESPSIPEISLEPLGLFGESPAEQAATHEKAEEPEIGTVQPLLPLLEPLEPQAPTAEPETSEQSSLTTVSEPQPEIPVEALLSVPQEVPPAREEALPAVPETPEITTASEAEVAPAEAIPSAPAAADLLTRLLDEEEPFPQAVASAAPATSPVSEAPSMPSAPTPRSSVFSGDVDLDELLHDGVVTDATALAQLFHGGYRNRISKLAVSAKDLQNVPEEMRQAIKLTVVALSPIELSIARDLAMRLSAPGFVGEALLVAKKMGYENYLTTYRNISKNYKDISIVETTSLKVPDVASSESSGELISFN